MLGVCHQINGEITDAMLRHAGCGAHDLTEQEGLTPKVAREDRNKL